MLLYAAACFALWFAGKAGDYDMVIQLFENLQATQLKPDVWTYTSLINACQTCGKQWKQGIAFFQEMESQGEYCLIQQHVRSKLCRQTCIIADLQSSLTGQSTQAVTDW